MDLTANQISHVQAEILDRLFQTQGCKGGDRRKMYLGPAAEKNCLIRTNTLNQCE